MQEQFDSQAARHAEQQKIVSLKDFRLFDIMSEHGVKGPKQCY